MNSQLSNKGEMCPNPSNPVSLVQIKPNIDPASTTNIQVSGSSNAILSTLSDSDVDSKNLSPIDTSQSSNNSIIHSDINDLNDNSNINNNNNNNNNNYHYKNNWSNKSYNKNIERSSFSLQHNADSIKQKRLPNSDSHSKLTDLAHKVSDFLFSTRRSIDSNNSHNNDSASPSPIHSRENSFVSLSSLARNSTRPNSQRKSFLFRSTYSPPKNSKTYLTLNQNLSTTSLNSTITNNSLCHFSCTSENNNNNDNNNNSKVKETHYVHVEYDPITRKRILNTYEILKDLGSGQHGKVKLAKDIATGNKVAIKIVDRTGKPALMLSRLSRGKSQTQEDKIRKEIAIMKKCNHPHVVKLIEVLDAENSRKIYLVLEYLEKGEIKWQLTPEDIFNKIQPENNLNKIINISLEDCVSEPLLELDKTKKIFRDILSGLEYLHYQGIIHRDIKPSNLLVGHNDEVKISDFGVSFATNLDGEVQDEIELAKTAGTPAFLAPELCRTENKDSIKVTYKIDIWALGVTLYCLIFGCLPFYADSEYQLFQNICHDDVKFPDMTRWRVAKKLNNEEFNIIKDLILKLLDKNPTTRIEIDEIKKHPFVINDLNGKKWIDDSNKWDKNTKINVSNEEMDDAVVGLGNRIKKRLTEAFRRHKTIDSKTNNDQFDSINGLIKSFPMMGLKDDCSYILSEENDPRGFSDIDDNLKNNDSQISLSLLNDDVTSNFKSSKSTTCVCVANAICNARNSNEKCNKSNCLDSNENKNINDRKLTKSTNPENHNHNISKNSISSEKTESDEYDYRDDLNENTQYGSDNFEAVKLTVNPSFASLDSFYDDSYSKFLNNSNSVTSATYNGIGSYSSRNNNITMGNSSRIHSGYHNRMSPNLQPTKNIPTNITHSVETRDSLSMVRKLSNSPISNGTSMPSIPPQSNINTLRGVPSRIKTSPAQSTANIPVINSLRSPKQMVTNKFHVNPMLNSNSQVISGSNRSIALKGTKKAIFSNMLGSNSSSDDSGDDDDDDKPIEISKLRSRKPVISKASNNKSKERKVLFTSGDDCNDDDDNSTNDNKGLNTNNSNGIVYSDNAQRLSIEFIPHGNSVLPDRSAIYGTKLNLINKELDDSSKSNLSSNSDSDGDELFLNFGKSKNVLPRFNNNNSTNNNNNNNNSEIKNMSRSSVPQKLESPSYLSAGNIMELATPTIVDVPANIFDSQNNSIDINQKNMNSKSSYIISDSNNIKDEVAILRVDQNDDFDQ